MGNNLATTGTLASGSATITGDATHGLRVNQGADVKGIYLYGFDDMSAKYLHTYLGSTGAVTLYSSDALNFQSAGIIYLKPSGGGTVGFFTDTAFGFSDDKDFRFGGTYNIASYMRLSTSQTNPSLVLGLSDFTGAGSESRTLIISDASDRTFNFAHPEQATPTVFIHSAAQSTTQWLGLTHDGTNGLITSGTGEISFDDDNLTTAGNVTANMLRLPANTTGMVCDAGNEGGIYYDGTANKHRGCDGTNWNDMY